MTQQVFNSNGTFTVPAGVTSIDVLIVGGGGRGGCVGGGTHGGGGGGAGQVRQVTGIAVTAGQTCPVVVGAGGVDDVALNANPGAASSITVPTGGTVYSAAGGGYGGFQGVGGNGASGGGGGSFSGSNQSGGTASAGNAGGTGFSSATTAARAGGGGGGAGAAGGNASTNVGGNGGAGVDKSSMVGTSVGAAGWFGGGGGGGGQPTPGTGGQGGGGAATTTAGTANTGGGGGGARGAAPQRGAAGGSGVVIVVYTTAAPNVPTSVASPAQTGTTLGLSWAAPSGGGPVSSYDVRIDGGSASTATSPHTFTGLSPGTSHTLEVRAVGAGGTSSWVSVTVSTVAAPNVPTALSAVAHPTSLDLSWAAPSGGGPVSSYDVRIDGGSASTATSPHTFTGLTASTSHTLEVRAVGAGGTSSWASLVVSTLSPPPPGYYRATIGLGSHSWEVEHGDEAAYGPLLPLTFGWEIADSVDFFPAPPSLTTGSFRVQTNDASDLADVVKGTPVSIRIYVDNDPDADPWQWLDGVVTQLDGEVVQSSADADKLDFRTTVYFADDNARLADVIIGITEDWPMERISDRITRIDAESHVIDSVIETGVAFGTGMQGWLPARPMSPISVLDALRATLRDAADHITDSGEWYGRYVFNYDATTDPVNPDLYVRVFRRRLFADGSQQQTIDGGLVRAEGRWTKQPGPHAATWGIVNNTVFGTPDGSAPFVRKVGLVMLPDAPDGDSATELDHLGESMLPDGSTALDGWSTRSLTYLAYLDPTPVGPIGTTALPGWASLPLPGNSMLVRPVVITPIGPELELNAVDYVAGTLTGARLIIPPGGKYVIEFRLRAELLDGTDLP